VGDRPPKTRAHPTGFAGTSASVSGPPASRARSDGGAARAASPATPPLPGEFGGM